MFRYKMFKPVRKEGVNDADCDMYSRIDAMYRDLRKDSYMDEDPADLAENVNELMGLLYNAGLIAKKPKSASGDFHPSVNLKIVDDVMEAVSFKLKRHAEELAAGSLSSYRRSSNEKRPQ